MPVIWTNNGTNNKWSVGTTATFTATGDLPDWITSGNFSSTPRYVTSDGSVTAASGGSDGVNYANGELTIQVGVSLDINDWTVQVYDSNDSTNILRWPGFGAVSATWADPGCQAVDAESGDLTHQIVRTYEQQDGDSWSAVQSIDQSAGGKYRITYNVTDGNLNADSVTRVVTLPVPVVEPTQEVGNWASGKPSARNGHTGAAGNHFMYVQSDQLWNNTTGDQTMGYYLQMPCATSGLPAHSSMEITHVSGTFTWEQARLDALDRGGQLACIRYTSQHEWVSCLKQSGWLGGVRVQYRAGSRSDGDIDGNAISGRMYWYWTDSTTPVSIVETSTMTPRAEMTRHLACGHAAGTIQDSVPETSPCAPESPSPCTQPVSQPVPQTSTSNLQPGEILPAYPSCGITCSGLLMHSGSITVGNGSQYTLNYSLAFIPAMPAIPLFQLPESPTTSFQYDLSQKSFVTFDDHSNYVGVGEYTHAGDQLQNAKNWTFDSIAIDRGTHFEFWTEPNFQGEKLIDVKGPKLISNALYDISYPLLRPPSVTGSNSGMHNFFVTTENGGLWNNSTGLLDGRRVGDVINPLNDDIMLSSNYTVKGKNINEIMTNVPDAAMVQKGSKYNMHNWHTGSMRVTCDGNPAIKGYTKLGEDDLHWHFEEFGFIGTPAKSSGYVGNLSGTDQLIYTDDRSQAGWSSTKRYYSTNPEDYEIGSNFTTPMPAYSPFNFDRRWRSKRRGFTFRFEPGECGTQGKRTTSWNLNRQYARAYCKFHVEEETSLRLYVGGQLDPFRYSKRMYVYIRSENESRWNDQTQKWETVDMYLMEAHGSRNINDANYDLDTRCYYNRIYTLEQLRKYSESGGSEGSDAAMPEGGIYDTHNQSDPTEWTWEGRGFKGDNEVLDEARSRNDPTWGMKRSIVVPPGSWKLKFVIDGGKYKDMMWNNNFFVEIWHSPA